MNVHKAGTTPANYPTTQIIEGEQFIPRNRFKVLVVGEKNSGKSALIKRFVWNVFNSELTQTDPRQVLQRRISGFQAKVELLEVDAESLYIDDSLSEEEKRRLRNVGEWWDVNAVLVLYDISSGGAFDRCLHNVKLVSRLSPPACEICFVGTKCDLKDDRKVSFKEADSAAERMCLSLFEVSSKTGINCAVCLEEMVERSHEKRNQEVDAFLSETHFPQEAPPYPPAGITNTNESYMPSIFCFKWWRS